MEVTMKNTVSLDVTPYRIAHTSQIQVAGFTETIGKFLPDYMVSMPADSILFN
jgi:hypothetical protein